MSKLPLPWTNNKKINKIKVTWSCLTLCDPMDWSRSGSSVHGDSLGKNTVVGNRSLLQGILPTQRSNSGLLHFRQIFYSLSHQKSPSSNIISEKTLKLLSQKKENSKVKWTNCSIDTGNKKSSQTTLPNY